MTEELKNTQDTALNSSHTSGGDNPKMVPFLYEPPKAKQSTLAMIISIVLHPIFMTFYAILLIFLSTDLNYIYKGQFLLFMAPVLFLSVLIPASGIYLLKTMNYIDGLSLREENNRFLPFLILFVSYGMLFFYFFSAGLSMWFLGVLAVPIILLVIYAIVSSFWNISMHMIGIGGMMGIILSVCFHVKGLDLYVLFIILFILAGCLGVSRLIQNKNTSAQVYVGFLVGFGVAYLSVWLGAYWGVIMFLNNFNIK